MIHSLEWSFHDQLCQLRGLALCWHGPFQWADRPDIQLHTEEMSLEMQIKNTKGLLRRVHFLLFGVATMIFATNYQIGTAAQMGPGYFPFVLGGMMTVLGAHHLCKGPCSARKGSKDCTHPLPSALLCPPSRRSLRVAFAFHGPCFFFGNAGHPI